MAQRPSFPVAHHQHVGKVAATASHITSQTLPRRKGKSQNLRHLFCLPLKLARKQFIYYDYTAWPLFVVTGVEKTSNSASVELEEHSGSWGGSLMSAATCKIP